MPGGRGQGEPLRLMADIGEGEDIVSVFPYVAGEKMLVAASDGRGFIAPCDEMVGGTRKGKILLNRDAGGKAALIVPAVGDHVATIGQNRKLLIFPLDQVPEMARGKGVRLQKYREGGISDAQGLRPRRGTDLGGFGPAHIHCSPSAICATGSATAPKPAACRRRDFRRTTSLDRQALDSPAQAAFVRGMFREAPSLAPRALPTSVRCKSNFLPLPMSTAPLPVGVPLILLSIGCLRSVPRHIEALRQFGLTLWAKGQIETAIGILKAALALAPEETVLWNDLAGALFPLRAAGRSARRTAAFRLKRTRRSRRHGFCSRRWTAARATRRGGTRLSRRTQARPAPC